MRIFENKLRYYPRPYITDKEIEMLWSNTADSRYGKVKRLLAQGQLLHIRRGLYCIAEHPIKPHPFELAHFIFAPSYVSFESALAYHQLIPEAVYTITNACVKPSREFHTPLGTFSYLHLPLKNFYMEVELITENSYRFFIAKPWKAICDLVYCYKKDRNSLDSLLESLRINPQDLPPLRDKEREALKEYYHQHRLSQFLKKVAKL